jgi:hypothetical protein
MAIGTGKIPPAPAPVKWHRRRRLIWAGGALAFLVLAVFYVLAATDPTDNIALSRNDVVAAEGGRVWKGTFWNHSDSLYTDLDAVILFLDKDGVPVGQARGGAGRLDPGEVFHVEAPLPQDAARMQIYRMAWSREGAAKTVLGPYKAWDFGYVTDKTCGETRTAIGSCSEQKEQDS